MRILIIQPGIGPYRLDFFNRLARLCTLKIVYFYDEATEQKFPEPLAAKLVGCEVEKVTGGWDLRGYYPIRPRLGRVIRDFKPDVVVGYEYNTLMLHLLLLRRGWRAPWKLLLWSSDNAIIANHCRPVRRIFRRIGTRGCDGMLLYSDEVKQVYASKLLPPDKIEVMPNIQDAERIRGDVDKAGAEAAALGGKYHLGGKKVFLYTGRLKGVKDLPTLLNAFKAAAVPDTVLILVGGGSEMDALVRLRRELDLENAVIFAGACYHNELWAHYALAGCLVLPSRFEPFGAVVNEALAAGIPCVVSDRVGAKVLIRDCRQGLIFKSGNISELAAAMNTMAMRMPIFSGAIGKLPESLMPWTMEEYIVKFMNFCRNLTTGGK